MWREYSLAPSVLEVLKQEFQGEYTREKVFSFVKVQKEKYFDAAKLLRENGFERLLTVSAIDWLDENEFEVYFLVYNPAENVYVKVSTRIPRENPEIQSLSSIWENSAMHEREVWELFGITFEGNTMLKPLFLEGWKGPHPFLKDFDWRKYVKEFPM